MLTAILTGILLANPEATISYKKSVMVDPNYKPTMTAEEIEKALATPARPRPPLVQPAPPAPRRYRSRVAPVSYYHSSPGYSYGGCGYRYSYRYHYRPWIWSPLRWYVGYRILKHVF